MHSNTSGRNSKIKFPTTGILVRSLLVHSKCGPLARPSAPINSIGARLMTPQYSTTRMNQFRPRATPQMSLKVSSIRPSMEIAAKISTPLPGQPSVPLRGFLRKSLIHCAIALRPLTACASWAERVAGEDGVLEFWSGGAVAAWIGGLVDGWPDGFSILETGFAMLDAGSLFLSP